mgnify:CR=1 FL=1
MAYTPELSQRHSGALRRLAWAVNKPMTKTLAQLFEFIGTNTDPFKVCSSCRDKSFCQMCVFYRDIKPAQKVKPT